MFTRGWVLLNIFVQNHRWNLFLIDYSYCITQSKNRGRNRANLALPCREVSVRRRRSVESYEFPSIIFVFALYITRFYDKHTVRCLLYLALEETVSRFDGDLCCQRCVVCIACQQVVHDVNERPSVPVDFRNVFKKRLQYFWRRLTPFECLAHIISDT